MGQALADRLQQQIAKGEWSLQLRMNPAKLGQVDVTLDMTAAGLEAVFQSDNALTRELITLGSHRLKESLTQSGMNLANVFVNSDGDRQAGGNPTQQQKQARASKPDVQDSARAATAVAPSRIMRPDGWDVLA
jgi:flagellar hook-length control protein FliK